MLKENHYRLRLRLEVGRGGERGELATAHKTEGGLRWGASSRSSGLYPLHIHTLPAPLTLHCYVSLVPVVTV